MAAARTEALTIALPKDVIDMLRKAATERRQTPDQIVAEALRFSLQPVRQEALQRLKGHILAQQLKPAPELRAHLEAHLDEREQEQLSQLLELNRTEGLNAEEQAELAKLFDRIEAVATEKAAAIWLLSGQAPEPDAPR